MRFLQNKRLIFALLFLLGFFYRLVLAFHTESSLIWDMQGYNDLAHALLNGEFAASCCNHGPGYPMFLAAIYSIFGIDNLFAVRLVQISLDGISAYFVYKTGIALFGKHAGRISLVLFLSNPFISSYTGLRLGETLLVFAVSAIAYVLTQKKVSRSRRMWLLLGCLLALLVAIKVAYYFFVLLLGFLFIFTVPQRKYIFLYIYVTFVGFMAISSYALTANYLTFKKLSIIPPYRTTGGLLYASFSLGRYPELASEFTDPGVSAEYSALTNEYYQYVNYDPASLVLYDKKYKALFFDRLRRQWEVFESNTERNIIWMWDKRFLAPYSDPFYPTDSFFLQVLNIGYIVVFVFGMVKKKLSILNPFFIFTLVYFLYISIVLGMVSNETRLTIPYYPLIMIWGGYGLRSLLHMLERWNSKRNASSG